ncbi:MAG: sugar transferase [Acidobacterium ailaaui]|nr:sugar transferase [Pseudacidobacterium ailaaui]
MVTRSVAGLSFASIPRRTEDQEHFLQKLAHEWRRAERSRRPLLLVLFEAAGGDATQLKRIPQLVAPDTRETDIWGWFEQNTILGAIFAELGNTSVDEARDSIVRKIRRSLDASGIKNVHLSAYVLPARFASGQREQEEDLSQVFSVLAPREKQFQQAVKRVGDILGSSLLLFFLSPLFALIAIAVKCTSRGPILYRQTRVGQHGRHFTFMKFRSMKAGNDPSLHEAYCRKLIEGKAEKHKDENGAEVFKITSDPRITPVGKFLRKTSLDELPQLWNVLRGEMSLVGPRPPIPYEVSCYDVWHRRRVLEVKPGMTGLWQVRGRNRTTFDEMVRLDLRYAHKWSLWLDLKILLETPFAVLKGAH